MKKKHFLILICTLTAIAFFISLFPAADINKDCIIIVAKIEKLYCVTEVQFMADGSLNWIRVPCPPSLEKISTELNIDANSLRLVRNITGEGNVNCELDNSCMKKIPTIEKCGENCRDYKTKEIIPCPE